MTVFTDVAEGSAGLALYGAKNVTEIHVFGVD
jgi:hypothetical protein